MLLILLLDPPGSTRTFTTATRESNLQICSCTEHLACTCHNYTLDTLVEVEHLVGDDNLLHHEVGEGIVLRWAVESEKDDGGSGGSGGRDVGELDMLIGEG